MLSADNLITAIKWILGVLIGSRIVEPVYDFVVDYLKNDSGTAGKIYNRYSRTLGRIIFLRKAKRRKPLEEEGYEYKIYNEDGQIKAYKSKVVRLDQNFYFKRIQGEISRVTAPNKSFTSYFKGYIKNAELDYLIWNENYRNEKGSFYLTTHFKIPTDENEKDIPGITVEDREGVVTRSFTILSFTSPSYPSVRRLLRHKDFYKDYLSQINISYDTIPENENNFITN